MTLEQLRIFVGVAEREHMTRAAEALGVRDGRHRLRPLAAERRA